MTVTSTMPMAAQLWDDEILPSLADYVRIPALSPAFDRDWATTGALHRAVQHLHDWVAARLHRLPGATVEIVELPGRTPVLFVDVPAADGSSGPDADTVLLYGHYDKQPPTDGWDAGLGPWTPVVRDGRLYGRGAADDGYALFASFAAIETARATGGAHARCVILIEGSEESGSPDLPAYVEALAGRIGSPSLMVCLDSGCADYERLWLTTSLRGLVAGTLTVRIATEGKHSGAVGGVVPSTFRIARMLLDRVEDAATGRVLLAHANVPIPPERAQQAAALIEAVGDGIDALPLLPGVDVRTRPAAEIELDRTWRPALHVTGADGFPSVDVAGNVLRPFTSLKLSLRLPPTADVDAVAAELATTLCADPPFGAEVTWVPDASGPGWNAPDVAPWLEASLAASSDRQFGRPLGHVGEGGTIPLMGLLQRSFPTAQFVIVGVLGPGSNAHGPNEFLHIETGRRLTAAMADALVAHATRGTA